MKPNKLVDLIITLLLIPLWLGLLTDFIKKIPWLHYTAIVITTLLVLFVFVRIIRELLITIDAHYNFQCRRMDTLVRTTRKKIQRIITKTNNPSVIDYALAKLHEITPSNIFKDTITEQAEKEQRPDIKEILLIWAEKNGGKR